MGHESIVRVKEFHICSLSGKKKAHM